MIYKCKGCEVTHSIDKEWIELGVNRLFTCNKCGHKVNLIINAPNSKSAEKKGTVLIPNSTSNVISYTLKIIESPSQENLTINLVPNQVYFIGRDPSIYSSPEYKNPIYITINGDDYVSRIHCQIEVKKRNDKLQLIIKDIGSLNHTCINEEEEMEPEDKILLQVNDKIKIGDTVLQITQ